MSCRALAALLLIAGVAQAEPVVLRMAGVAPEGTMWSREVHALARDVEAATHGQVKMKWYQGGIAGDELTIIDRIRRKQLDGEAGGAFCERLAPSVRVLRIVGLIERRDELKYVVARLRGRIDAEMAQAGFVSLGFASFGVPILMTRTPVASMDDLRRTRLWVWHEDDVIARSLKLMGVPVVSSDVFEAGPAYDNNQVDGFVSMPLGGLGYRWSAQAHYFTELPMGILPGCLVIAQRAFDALPIDHQQAIRGAAAKMLVHFEEMGRAQDEALLGGLFDKQGMKRVPVRPELRDQFFSEARRHRDEVARQVSTPELLASVLGWLADFRAEHTTPVKR
jgi:TRAP-type C4-dicarboxylate transport system substrate-binding protein